MLQNAGRFAVFAVWAMVLIWLLLSGRYTGFLHPRFWPLIAIGTVILEGFLLVGSARHENHSSNQTSGASVTTGLVVLVPVFFCLAIPSRPLGSHYLANRASALERPVSLSLTSAPEPLTLIGGVPHLDLLAISHEPARHAGHEIVVDGFVFRPDQLTRAQNAETPEDSPASMFHLCRFAMTCCAADALPLTLPVNWPQAGALTNDTWVRVTGTLEVTGGDREAAPMLLATRIEKIPCPDPPYLYLGSFR